MSVLKAKAQAIAREAGQPQAGLLDVVIEQVIGALISLLRDKCNASPSQALSRFARPTPFNRLQVRRACVQSMGRQELRRYQGRIEDGVFEELRRTSITEMEQLYQETPQEQQGQWQVFDDDEE